jgi:hypothetical protein
MPAVADVVAAGGVARTPGDNTNYVFNASVPAQRTGLLNILKEVGCATAAVATRHPDLETCDEWGSVLSPACWRECQLCRHGALCMRYVMQMGQLCCCDGGVACQHRGQAGLSLQHLVASVASVGCDSSLDQHLTAPSWTAAQLLGHHVGPLCIKLAPLSCSMQQAPASCACELTHRMCVYACRFVRAG